MKKVLIITYYWPPAAGAGVQRWLQLSKYLPDHGWQPIILTVGRGTYSSTDPSLENEINKDLLVFKSKTFEPFTIYNFLKGKKETFVEEGMGNLQGNKSIFEKLSGYIRSNFFIPDARIGWKRFAVKLAIKIIREYNISCVITTGPPHSCHLIGLSLKKKFNLPWITDFRDPWTTVFYNQLLTRSKRAWQKDKDLENEVLQVADGILVVGNGMKDEFSDRNSNIIVLTNGFDKINNWKDQRLSLPRHKYNFTYIGNFKYLQNHEPLWVAISELVKENHSFKDFLAINFVGNVNSAVKSSLNEHGLNKFIHYFGYQSHASAVKAMHTTDLLLFIISDSQSNHRLVSGKIFEYLSTQNPIFAVGLPGGDADVIIKNCGHRPVVNFNEKDIMKKEILMHFTKWTKNNNLPVKISSRFFEKYARKNQASELNKFLEEVIENSHHANR